MTLDDKIAAGHALSRKELAEAMGLSYYHILKANLPVFGGVRGKMFLDDAKAHLRNLSGGVAQQSASSPPVEGAGVPFDSVVPAVSVAPPSQSLAPAPSKFDHLSTGSDFEQLSEVAPPIAPADKRSATQIAQDILRGRR